MTLTESQVWTLIGVFAAVMVGGQALIMTVVKARLDAFATLLRFELEHLNRDVQFLMRKEFGDR